MKKIVLVIVFGGLFFKASAQSKLDDFGRMVINTYIPDDIGIPNDAAEYLRTKLNQITSSRGMGGSDVNPRFVITAQISTVSKDIIAGPPQMIAQNLELKLYMGDAISNTLFASAIIELKGVGTNETKALMAAFKTINVRAQNINTFLEVGKQKILDYYTTQCDFILKDSENLVNQELYDEAIYNLSIVPEVVQDCYFSALDKMTEIYQLKIDLEGNNKLNQAKIEWAASQNAQGAEKAGSILTTIHPMASCQEEVTALIRQIDSKLKADEKRQWEFKMKQYEDEIALQKEEIRIAEEKSIRDDAFRENQAERDAVHRENQAERDAVYRENQSQRNQELNKIRVREYLDVAANYVKYHINKVAFDRINWR